MKTFLAVCFAVGLLTGCVTVQSVQEYMQAASFSEAVEGRYWQLEEVRAENGDIVFDRRNLTDEFFQGVYTMQFDGARVFGKAAPNRFNAPYTINGSAIEFMPAASTMMAAFIEPEGLREHEFFGLLANAHNWEIRQDHLWLHTTNSENESVVMIFTPTEG